MSSQKQRDMYVARFEPKVAALGRAAIRKMETRLPGATEIVYDNYNALVIGFGPTDRASDCVFSLALYPRWVNLFFLDGAQLSDPDGLLNGTGSRVRHIRLLDAGDLDAPAVQTLMTQALELADPPMPSGPRRRTIVIRSVSARQRPRTR